MNSSTEKIIRPELSHPGFTYINDIDIANEVNKNSDFVPPPMEKYLLELQAASGRDFSNLILVSGNALFFMSGNKHIQLRKKVMNTLGKGNINKWIPIFDEAIDAAILSLKNSGTPDIVADFTYPLFLETTQRVLGVRPNDPERFDYWTQQLQTLLQPLLPLRQLIKMEAGFGDLLDQMREKEIGEKEDNPASLLSELRDFRLEGYSEDDVLATILVLYGASVNISQTMANVVWHLLSAPEAISACAKDPAWVTNNLEYLIKISASPRYIHSISMTNKKIGGLDFSKGDNVLIDLLEVHNVGCPFAKEKSWTKEELSNNSHIAFGKGIHFCVGAFHSRVLIERAIPKLFASFPKITKLTDVPDVSDQKQTVILNSLKVSLNEK
ncbi:cytochrome P450 [Pedobacter polysacchareus]|uniref:cytochrome P450 n=1 Tax=Pedobacter polysacchareus TaxID=2861973 RepID=UPI001C98EB28|nr:cytochrome P450 [Pedobacter polysacchareus]